MSGCGSCSACGGDSERAQEYKNGFGQSAVECPICGNEVTFEKLPPHRKITCLKCECEIEVIPLLLN